MHDNRISADCHLDHCPLNLRLAPTSVHTLMQQCDETRCTHDLASVFAAKETGDGSTDEVFGSVGGHRTFLAFSRCGRGGFFRGFCMGHCAGCDQLNFLGAGVYSRNAVEPWPHSGHRSPRLAAQASRSWSQAGASLQ